MNCIQLPVQELNNGKSLRFQLSWFTKYPWLHVQHDVEGVLCHSCSLAARRGLVDLNRWAEPAFRETGYKSWKKALEKFKAHERSQAHRFSLEQLANSKVTIKAKLNKQVLQQQQDNRVALEKILSSVKLCARQGLAMRGHEKNEGNFQQLLHVRSEDCEELKQFLSHQKNYTSPDIQNEILHIMADKILRDIMSSSTGRLFAVLADGTQDINGIEQEAIIIRIVDDNLDVEELFVGYYEMDSTSGDALSAMIEDVLCRLNLPLANIR